MNVVGIDDGAQVTAGTNFSCALRSNGQVSCWGTSDRGQVGAIASRQLTPVTVPGLSNVIAVDAGGSHACALRSDRSVWCWGANSYGQIGSGTSSTTQLRPVSVFTDAVQVTASERHTCALRSDGSVWCWGNNSSGQLGDGTTTSRPSPVVVSGITRVSAVAAGGDHTCAITASGAMYCWGSGYSGETADPARRSTSTPQQVIGMPSAMSCSGSSCALPLWSSPGLHCAARPDRSVACWGLASIGNVFGPTARSIVYSPLVAPSLADVRQFTGGRDFICQLTSTGTVRCAGGLNSCC